MSGEPRVPHVPHVPAIDGLRGLAVALVVLFHAGVPGAGGGFLGVSLFFTLSGYLITQLLLREHDQSGRVSLRRFWARRVRRLAPAALACLAAVAATTALTGAFPGGGVRGDVLASLANVANWRFAVADASYEDLFTAGPSPVLHFWSLAIEEQFYVVFPVVVGLVLARLGRRALPAALAAGGALGVLASVTSGADLAYYGTHARAPELLAGALLAVALPIGRPLGHRRARAVAAAGGIGLAGLLVLVATVRVSTGGLYGGGLPAVSLLSSAIVAATVVPGPLQAVCSWRPAVAVGRRSYGIYVYHWPLFLVLGPERLGVDGPALVLVRVVATAGVSWVSFALLEDPIRQPAGARRRRRRAPGAAMAGAMAAVVALSMLAPSTTPLGGVAAPAEVVAFGAPGATAAPVLDVAVLGSEPTVLALVRQVAVPGYAVSVREGLRPACPLLLPDRPGPGCASFAAAAGAAIGGDLPDLIVVGIGEAERSAIRGAVAALPSAPVEERVRLAEEAFGRSTELVDTMIAALPDRPVLFVDTVGAAVPDPLATRIGEAALQQTSILSAVPERTAIARVLDTVAAARHDRRQRLLVVGDSTSYDLALGLDQLAGDRFEVVWAGGQNCGLVHVAEVRWWSGAQFSREECPSPSAIWPDVVARLRPEIVLAVASLPEMSEQRYGDGDGWSVPGDPAYVQVHDDGMAELQALLAGSGALTLVATTPPIARGSGFAAGPLGGDERLEGWMEQVRRWDRQWRSVGVIDWATVLLDAETAAGRGLRHDGVHLDGGAVTGGMGELLLSELDRALASVRADARASSCRVEVGGTQRLDLSRCRVES